MRRTVNDYIRDIWQAGGPFIGADGAPHGRVTVEIGWQIRTSGTSNIVGSFDRGPVRYFQRRDDAQVETEVPNIKTINMSKAVGSDAASCTIVLTNTKMLANGTDNAGDSELGQPGYYTPNRGDSAAAASRWGHAANPWSHILQPNALLRVYQGYGGKDKTIAQAIADGNIIQSGTFLIDEVNPVATGELSITCRDMGKLLIDQNLYPPLVPPSGPYPLYYYRFVDSNHPAIPYGTTVYGTGFTGVPVGQTSTAAPTIEVEAASSEYAGHPKEGACDFGYTNTYWLSAGAATSDNLSDMEYIQFRPVGGGVMDMGAFDIFPWGGDYQFYVSVMVGGVWQGSEIIPYTGPLAMAIPHVQLFSQLGWEQPFLFGIPGGPYINAERIRFTFRHLARSSIGPQYFRCGIRDITVGTFTNTMTGGGRTILGMARNSDANNNGYWLAGTDGGVFSFGDSQFYGSMAGTQLDAPMIGITSTGHNSGYWMAGADGGVFSFGTPFYGSLPYINIHVSNIVGIERSSGGNGYYLVSSGGAIYTFGDAVYYGNYVSPGTVTGMAVRPQGGYWITNSAGDVNTFGGATYHGGSPVISAPITSIAATPTGDGYWLVGEDGSVFTFGDAQFYGSLFGTILADPISDIEPFDDGSGYWLVAQDGGVFTFGGGHNFWGSLPQTFDFEQLGNYADYSDIIKDLLLWAGFWLQDTLGPSTPPDVFGNIESTGAFAPDTLREGFFDKKAIIDVIHSIREIVGYVARVGDLGEFHFEPANVWSIGNWWDDTGEGAPLLEIDEAIQMTAYQTKSNDTDARSQIIVSSNDPVAGFTDTITTTRESTWGQTLLKGIVRPTLLANQTLTNPVEQGIFAELIDLFSFLAERQGNVTCAGNPIIQVDDQVRLWERQTAETYVHYVTGINSTMDLAAGTYTQTISTNWLGDGTAWFLTYSDPIATAPVLVPVRPSDSTVLPACVHASTSMGNVAIQDGGNAHAFSLTVQGVASVGVVDISASSPIITPPASPGWQFARLWAGETVHFPGGPRGTLATHNGDLTVTTNLSSTRVFGKIIIGAANLHLTDVWCNEIDNQGIGGTTFITYSRIIGGSGGPSALYYNNYNISYSEVSGSFDGLKAFTNSTVDNCWIHNLNNGSGSSAGNSAGGYTHNDGIQMSGGTGLYVTNSRIEDTGYNSGIFIDSDQGVINTVRINNNYIQGGNFALWAVNSASANFGIPHDLSFTNNVLGAPAIPAPSFAGYSSIEDQSGNLIPCVWQGNVTEYGAVVSQRQKDVTTGRYRTKLGMN